jgi:hypothetical protein
MDLSPLVIVLSVGAIALVDLLAVWFGADSREPMLDDHLR